MKDKEKLRTLLTEFYKGNRMLTVLTGAGVSAESGIPTFRGKEGYWVVGSRNYMPEEMATLRFFRQHPLESWKWYLYRNTICRQASPNKGHLAIVELERIFGDRFRLISQNVDGLHTRAGSSQAKSYYIHGSFDHTRCGNECSNAFYPFPAIKKDRENELSDADLEKLSCPKCGYFLRPHVLWFDEYYDEENYKAQSSLRTANETGLLLIAGTSGSTSLPHQIISNVAAAGGILIDINPADNIFANMAKEYGGLALQGNSGEILPEIVEIFRDL